MGDFLFYWVIQTFTLNLGVEDMCAKTFTHIDRGTNQAGCTYAEGGGENPKSHRYEQKFLKSLHPLLSGNELFWREKHQLVWFDAKIKFQTNLVRLFSRGTFLASVWTFVMVISQQNGVNMSVEYFHKEHISSLSDSWLYLLICFV